MTDIPYEQFDFDIIKITDHPLNATVVNEIWPLLRILWLALGPYELDLKFDPEYDTQELGAFNLPRINSYYKARYLFKIDINGDWHADFDHEIFIHGQDHPPVEFGKDFVFKFPWQDTGNWVRPIP